MSGLIVRAEATAQVVVTDLEQPQLGDDDRHHLEKVLRVHNGEAVIVTDGRGSWRKCVWHNAELHVEGESITELAPRQTEIAFALTKGDKPEWTVQKLTEIGVMRIVPFLAERSIVKWDTAKTEKHAERFRRVSYEAAMQSRRVWLPDIADIASIDDIVNAEFAFAAPGSASPAPSVAKIAIGPEGGWSIAEQFRAPTCIDLGPTILRAETAALVAAVRLCGHD